MSDDFFGKTAKEAFGEAKKQHEENKVVIGDQKIKLIPASAFFKHFGTILMLIFMMSTFLWFCGAGAYKMMSGTRVIPLFEKIKSILEPFFNYIRISTFSSLLSFILVWWFRLRPPMFDRWVRDIAKKRLSCEYIFFRGNYLFIHYDVGLNRNDVKEFVQEISDKSEHFTYYLDNIDIDSYTVSINIARKQDIPKRCDLDKKKDVLWNMIPMGEAVNNKRKCVSVIGWYLNDNELNKEAVETLPSTSLVIAGGTGSGKSVVENGIIGHITRHPDHIQGLLADVKMVEFNGLDQYKGIHKVALTVPEVAELLEQARTIMMDRFSFMKDQGKNNVYKVEAQVDWFEIDGKLYQFDEIMQCKIDGKDQLLTLDKIFEAVEEGKDVEINDLTLVD